MSFFNTNIDNKNNLTVHTLKGVVEVNSVYEKLEKHYATGTTKKVIWDARKADLSKVTTQKFQNVIKKLKEIAELRRGGKTAFVVANDLVFGLARMGQTFMEIEDIPFEFRIFRSMEDARKWLGIKD